MKIGITAIGFPYLSEAFSTREACALRDLGHEVRFFTRQDPQPDNVGVMPEGITVERDVAKNVGAFSPDVLYAGGIGFPSHLRCLELARALRVPFAFRIWSGLDTFTFPNARFYRGAAQDSLCLGMIVEDEFMASWATQQMGIPRASLTIVPNSLDLSAYLQRAPETPPFVLAVGRFVEKKGFIHLARVAAKMPKTRFVFIGSGQEGPALRAATLASPLVDFVGNVPLSDLPGWYSRAACLVAPCVKTARGDMDGIPTVVLEAMAAGCPVITTGTEMVRKYIQHSINGWLTLERDEEDLCSVIDLVIDPGNMGDITRVAREGKLWAHKHLDITKNVLGIEAVLGQESPFPALLASYGRV